MELRVVKVKCTIGDAKDEFEFIVGSGVTKEAIEEIARDEVMHRFQCEIEARDYKEKSKEMTT